jgi:hypothetical protein
MDANDDGQVTKQEIRAFFRGRAARGMGAMDMDDMDMDDMDNDTDN